MAPEYASTQTPRLRWRDFKDRVDLATLMIELSVGKVLEVNSPIPERGR